MIQSRFSKNPKPLCFSLMVTSKCNCDCDFCYWKSKKGQDDIPKEEIIRLLTEAGQIGYMDSILWGGEPLLREDFTEICKASHDAGLYGSTLLASVLPGRKFPYPKSLYAVYKQLPGQQE